MTAGDWSRAAKILDSADQVCLACHVRPDADALGSMLALALALTSRPGNTAAVVASFGDEPFAVPAILAFLPGTELLTPPAEFPDRPQVMVTLDAASIGRLGPLAAGAAAAGELIVLDHHASNTGFGTINLVDPATAATAVLTHRLITELGDSAHARHRDRLVRGPGHRHRLVQVRRDDAAGARAGRPPAEHRDRPRRRLPAPVRHRALRLPPHAGRQPEPRRARRRACDGHGLVWTTVTRADRGELSFDTARVRSSTKSGKTAGPEVAVVLKEADDGTWEVSVRSRALIDVGAACTALGGGGHIRAAGFSASGSPDAAVRALEARLTAP